MGFKWGKRKGKRTMDHGGWPENFGIPEMLHGLWSMVHGPFKQPAVVVPLLPIPGGIFQV
jgi:hypothetical protein